MGPSDRRFLSLPHEVWWGGFKSTTIQLQQAGWSISAEQDLHRDRIALAFRHSDYHMYGLTGPTSVDFYRYQRTDRPLVFQVRYMATEMTCQVYADLSTFSPIDARPQMIEVKDIEDFKIFATPLARTEEIIVEPATVMEMLEKIKAMQSPEQVAIRERNNARDRCGDLYKEPGPRQQFHAQILSFAA
jgi:hypothetical protein